jgi:hypothetical protein
MFAERRQAQASVRVFRLNCDGLKTAENRRSQMKSSIRLPVVLSIMLCAAAAIAQTNRGSISGTVSDKNGGVISGATVIITNIGANQSQQIRTSTDGAYAATSLDPVLYRITVEAPGFKRAVVDSVKVDTASTATVNVTLEAGTVETTVNISAETPLLNTASGVTGQTVTQRQIQDIPLNNRSVLDLAVTLPNVSGDAGSEDPAVTSGQPVPGFNLSVNGGRPGSTIFLADGVNNTGVGIARTVVSFTPETVQEFTVQTSVYSSEYGQTGGGVINVTTKKGTNDYNGEALWYHRNPVTNAGPFTTGRGPRTPLSLRYNQVSITAGGPVWLPKKIFGPAGYDGHDKTFFFFAYEPRYRRDFITTTTLLPTAAERAGDFSNLVRTPSGWLPTSVAAQFGQNSVGGITDIFRQFNRDASGRLIPIVRGTNQTYPQFPGNKIPQEFIDPTAVKLLQFMPQGGAYFIDNSGLVRNYIVNRFVRQDETRYTLNLDHSISKTNKINFRITTTPTIGVRGFGSDVNGNSAAYGDAKQYLIADNHIFSPTLINDLRLNYTRGVFSEDFSPEFSIKGGRNLATELGLPSLTAGGLPLFQISADGNGYNAFADIGSSGSTNNYNVEERYNINDIVYWTRGSMSWKFGVDLNHARLNVVPFFGASGGRWEFRVVNTSNNFGTAVGAGGNPLASLLIGVPNVVQVRPLLLDYNYRWNSLAGFAQNDWKVRPNLTLNLGLRYSLQYPRTEKHDLQGVFRPDLAQSVTLTDAQRRAIATGLGIATNSPIPGFIPTSASIPPFAFSGRGGRSRYISPVDYWGFEPRFGLAWSPKGLGWLTEKSFVIRGGYGISHAPLTGNNRAPNPDFGTFTQVSTSTAGSIGAGDAAQPVRLSGNPPRFTGIPLDQSLGVPADGLLFLNSIAVPGVADAGPDSGHVPYSQNWNLSLSFEPLRDTVIEVAYVGNKGTHLYMPQVNINPRNIDFVDALEAQNINSDTGFADPLGRNNLLGAPITVARGSVLSGYLGFGNLNRYFDPSANSIRHAAYIDLRRRVNSGLTFTANYTFGKSIDESSDAGPDTRVITEVGQTQGQVYYGAPRSSDRAVSTFDIKHNFNATFIWDLPVGRKRSFLNGAPAAMNAVVGGWAVTGVFRLQGGTPFLPFITDTNRLGGANRTIRPDLVPGVPLKNPLFSSDCPFGISSDNVTPCEPYINPAAFMRPAKGSLGNAPRTLDLRGPLQQYFDFSFQKDFPFPFKDKEGKRRINFRVDLINAFNHPDLRLANSSGTAGFTTNLPAEFAAETIGSTTTQVPITTNEYNAWAAANGRAPSATELANIRAMINAFRTSSNGALPLDFFHVPVPQGFATRTANSFDITTLEGYKLYRLRQVYDTNFGVLRVPGGNSRYIQFGIRIFF